MRKLSPLALLLLLCACGGGGDASGGMGVDGMMDCPNQPADSLVKNGSFECGANGTASSWFARDGKLETVSDAHSGTRAVKLTVTDDLIAKATLAYEPEVARDLGERTFCATVFVKGTTPAVDLVFRRSLPGMVEDVSFTGPPNATEWSRLPPNLILNVKGGNAERLLLLVQTRNARPGDTLFVDDIDVWRSMSGRCDEAR